MAFAVDGSFVAVLLIVAEVGRGGGCVLPVGGETPVRRGSPRRCAPHARSRQGVSPVSSLLPAISRWSLAALWRARVCSDVDELLAGILEVRTTLNAGEGALQRFDDAPHGFFGEFGRLGEFSLRQRPVLAEDDVDEFRRGGGVGEALVDEAGGRHRH